jgi:predicted thioesterase
MIDIGLKGNSNVTVGQDQTASAWGSGLLPVYATPAMIALMESTAAKSVEPYLEEGYSTVGILINIRHLAATPAGMKVRCESELIEIDRKRLVFKVRAYDEMELIGEGTHERFIINKGKFMEKAKGKVPLK